MSDNRILIKQTLDALERLMRMFAIERFLYLGCGLLSFALLVACLMVILNEDQVGMTELSLIFGSAGLITASAARVSYFLNKSFNLVSDVVRELANIEPRGEEGDDEG